MDNLFEQNCPVRQYTADGVCVGRCWHYLWDGANCIVHGNVVEAVARYRKTGELTDERETARWKEMMKDA